MTYNNYMPIRNSQTKQSKVVWNENIENLFFQYERINAYDWKRLVSVFLPRYYSSSLGE